MDDGRWREKIQKKITSDERERENSSFFSLTLLFFIIFIII